MSGIPRADRRDLRTQTMMFLTIGSVIGTMSLVYLLTDDDAGQMMLGMTSILALICGGFLLVRLRQIRAGAEPGGHEEADGAEFYLPHASIWPFWIGVAAFLLSNGLVLGTWFLVPGALVLAVALAGFARQTRDRT